MLRRFFSPRIRRVGGSQGVSHVLVRIPSERERRVGSRPRLEQRFTQTVDLPDGGFAAAGTSRRWCRLPWNGRKAGHEVHVSLAEQETQRSWFSFPCLAPVTERSIADEGRPQVSRVPIPGHRGAKSLRRFLGRQLQVPELAEVVVAGQIRKPLGDNGRGLDFRCLRGDGQRRPNRRRVDGPRDARAPRGPHVLKAAERPQQSQEA